ncbi:YbdD/YjiX family protein [Streptomyces sp. NBC_00237]|uniref:YbdD/YjiX family protein n=1 Tax=Streptomyces sp. NBC_00237 TaxID=2975687 RepID=UPI0022563CF6|nr:YbdD/YjiX family protein [Streptomyces sp. NBC_00237]MCX5204318.1 YbdD/YjiX family protein [Streptomyces sp. NBC_00237]
MSTGAPKDALSTAGLRHRLSRLRLFVRELTGEATYDRYVAHARSHDPDAPVMTRRAFERSRTDAREGDPRDGFRCC